MIPPTANPAQPAPQLSPWSRAVLIGVLTLLFTAGDPASFVHWAVALSARQCNHESSSKNDSTEDETGELTQSVPGGWRSSRRVLCFSSSERLAPPRFAVVVGPSCRIQPWLPRMLELLRRNGCGGPLVC